MAVRTKKHFEALQKAIKYDPGRLVFYAFDLLYLDGKDLRDQPLIDRRAKLNDLIGEDSPSPLQFSEESVGDGRALFRACAQHELEGIVSKLRKSRYCSGRSTTWLKTKCFTEGNFTLLGVDRDRKTGAARALLARADPSGLVYAGAAFIALDADGRDELRAKLEEFALDAPAIPLAQEQECPLGEA